MMQKIFYIFFISMVPILERTAIPIGIGMGLPFGITYVVVVIGNMIPVPFLIMFSKMILEWLSISPLISKFAIKINIGKRKFNFSIQELCKKIINKGDKTAKKIGNYKLFGLFIFVLIPLPVTGVWTSSLVAATLRLRVIPSIITIFLGVISSGIIISGISWIAKLIFPGYGA